MYLNHSTKPALRFMREKIDPFVCFFILTQKKKIFVENILYIVIYAGTGIGLRRSLFIQILLLRRTNSMVFFHADIHYGVSVF